MLFERRLSNPALANDWTRCLVFVLEQIGQPQPAFTELASLQARAPGDFDLLSQLVELAERTRQWDQAIEYQEQLVRLDRAAEPLEKLARLYRQVGRLEDATQIWDRVVQQPISATESIQLIDQLLLNEDFFAAQRLAEACASRFPDDWRLAYRAGLVHLAMEQFNAAHDTFESILGRNSVTIASATQGTAATTSFSPRPLMLGLMADRRFNELAIRRAQLGARHGRTLQEFTQRELLDAGGDGSLLATQVFTRGGLLARFARTA